MTFSLEWLKYLNETPEEREERTIGKDVVDKFIVSTMFTCDEGFETAICDDLVHVVERYKNKETAIKGHEKWVKFIQDGNRKIKSLGWSDTPFLDKEIEL